jgi:hypothetical protein
MGLLTKRAESRLCHSQPGNRSEPNHSHFPIGYYPGTTSPLDASADFVAYPLGRFGLLSFINHYRSETFPKVRSKRDG